VEEVVRRGEERSGENQKSASNGTWPEAVEEEEGAEEEAAAGATETVRICSCSLSVCLCV